MTSSPPPSTCRARASVWWLAVLCLLVAPAILAGTYQTRDDFLHEVFAGSPPKPQVLWVKGELRKQAGRILGHPFGRLRVRYWDDHGRTAWILEEVGKEKPISVGLVVDQGHLQRVKVLAFRESRGWEIRYPFFTDQFRGLGLKADHSLDRPIDSITGATLSVRAVRKLARLALLFHQHIARTHASP